MNPAITLPANVKIPLASTRWSNSGPRRASINSFGFGGANAHVILEDAASYFVRKGLTGCHATVLHPTLGAPKYGHGDHGSINGVLCPKPKVFLFSSNDKDGVKRNVERTVEYLNNKDQGGSNFLADLAHTLFAKRSPLPWKSFVVASDVSHLQQSLSGIPAPVRSSSTAEAKIALVFTGQGAQWFAMGKGLSVFHSFKDSMLKSERVLKSLGCPWSLEQELGRPEEESNLRATDYSQPACTALQVALVDLLKKWGVKPVAVVGHSSGEIAAAYCAGMISHEAAVEIAWIRGQVSATIAQTGLKGGMLAVNTSAEAVQRKLEALTRGRAVVGCFNCWSSCTVSGDKDAIDELQEALREGQISCTRLPMDVAYHSFHMETVRARYEAALANIPHDSAGQTIPMFSSVSGALVTPKEMNPSYWVQNLVKPVNFTNAMVSLLNHKNGQNRAIDRQAFANIFLEVGPHSALRTYVLDILQKAEKFVDLTYGNMLRKNFDGVETVLQSMGNLWTKAYPINMDLVNETNANVRMLVDLPPYAWNHSHTFWDESHLSRAYRLRDKPRIDLLGYRVAGTPEPTWRNFLRCNENPWIREHKVQGAILYPGAGMLVMAVEAAKQLADPNEAVHGYEMRDVNIVTALRVPDTEKGIEIILQFHARRTGTKAAPSNSLNEFSVSSWSEEVQEWTVHARGLISTTYRSSLSANVQYEMQLQQEKQKQDFMHAKGICERPARSFLYDSVETIGMQYGPTFRNMTELFASPGSSYGVVSVPDTKAVMPERFEYPAVVHPATLDSVLHLLFPCISGDEQTLTEAVVPFSFDRVFISACIPNDPGSKLHGFCTAKKTSYTTWMSSITVSDENFSEPLIIMEGLGLASVGGSDKSNSAESRALCFGQVWHEAIDLLEPSHMKELVYQRTIPNKDDESVLDLLEYICLVYIYQILEWFRGEGQDFVPADGFWQKYMEWMTDVVQDFPPLPKSPEEVERKMVAARERIAFSESGDITVQMVDRIGQNLANIFTRKVEPLQVMTEGDLLYTFYRGAFGTSFNSNVAEYIGLIADQNPGLRILEVGAGTGGTTFHVLERLRNEDGTSKASRYFFTDISPGFLAKAQDRFSKHGSIMEFGTLNIEKDPKDQGFESESFDLIVCANVLHATKSIQETLTHCYAVLKPGGKLVLSEVTIKRIFSGFIMV